MLQSFDICEDVNTGLMEALILWCQSPSCSLRLMFMNMAEKKIYFLYLKFYIFLLMDYLFVIVSKKMNSY